MRAYKCILATLLLLCCISSAMAESVISPMSVNIRTTYADLSISGDTATCGGRVAAYSSSSACSITIKLQKKDGSRWKTIKSWSANGNGSAALSESNTITSGSYRVSVTGNVDGETFSVNSATKTKN